VIANFFNTAKPINIVILIITLLLFYILAHLGVELPLFSLAFWALKLLGVLLLISLFFIYSFIINKNRLTATNSYALLFICLSLGLFYPVLAFPKILTSQLFLALSFRRIYSLRSNHNIREKLFDSAFLIAISSLFYIENAYFILLIYVALLVFQKSYWNYFIIPLIGFLLPYFLIYIYALSFNSFSYFDKITDITFSFNTDIIKNSTFFIYLDFIFLTGCIAYIRKTIKTSEFSNEFRTLWGLILAHFILATLLIFTGNFFNMGKAIYIVFPYAIIMGNYMQTINKKWFKELVVLLFVALIIGSVFYNFMP
jgi:hypothetical protein